MPNFSVRRRALVAGATNSNANINRSVVQPHLHPRKHGSLLKFFIILLPLVIFLLVQHRQYVEKINDSVPDISKNVVTPKKEIDQPIVTLHNVDGNTDIHKLLPDLTNKLLPKGKTTGHLIDLGAGVRDDDPMFPFVDQGWNALLVDGDPLQKAKMNARFPSKNAHKVISYITADTVPELLGPNGFDENIDMLKIDIDSFDCYVMHKLLKIVRPTIVVMEVNVKLPAHFRFVMFPGFKKNDDVSNESSSLAQMDFDSEKRGHVYGCSLAYQVLDLMKPNGYEIFHLDWNNAVFIDKKKASIDPPTLEEVYNKGYWGKPDRDEAFSFNLSVRSWNKFSVDELFRDMTKLFRSDASHKNHHIFIGSTTDNELKHGCFDASGKLGWADGNEKCSLLKSI